MAKLPEEFGKQQRREFIRHHREIDRRAAARHQVEKAFAKPLPASETSKIRGITEARKADADRTPRERRAARKAKRAANRAAKAERKANVQAKRDAKAAKKNAKLEKKRAQAARKAAKQARRKR